jgi:hypothetical protein
MLKIKGCLSFETNESGVTLVFSSLLLDYVVELFHLQHVAFVIVIVAVLRSWVLDEAEVISV